MISITPRIQIPKRELVIHYVRSSGPGGQNVNKVATKAVLRWNLEETDALPADVRERFMARYGPRLTSSGELILTADRERSQSRNADACVTRLIEMVRAVATPPRPRRPSRPTRGSVRRRLASKQHRSRLKRSRKSRPDED